MCQCAQARAHVCVCVCERERERERARENRQLFVDSMARVQFHVHRRPGCAAVPILLSSHCRPPLTETSRVVRAHLGIVSLNMHAIHIAPVASSYHSTNTHAARSRSFSCLSEIRTAEEDEEILLWVQGFATTHRRSAVVNALLPIAAPSALTYHTE